MSVAAVLKNRNVERLAVFCREALVERMKDVAPGWFRREEGRWGLAFMAVFTFVLGGCFQPRSCSFSFFVASVWWRRVSGTLKTMVRLVTNVVHYGVFRAPAPRYKIESWCGYVVACFGVSQPAVTLSGTIWRHGTLRRVLGFVVRHTAVVPHLLRLARNLMLLVRRFRIYCWYVVTCRRYSTTDLAAIRHRVATERADRVLYVVDVGQGSHFAQVCGCVRVVLGTRFLRCVVL